MLGLIAAFLFYLITFCWRNSFNFKIKPKLDATPPQALQSLLSVKPQVASHETLLLTISHGIEPAAKHLLVLILSHHLLRVLYSLK